MMPENHEQILKLLNKVDMTGPTPKAGKEVTSVFIGKLEWSSGINTITKKPDTFVVIPVELCDGLGCHIYRYSGKTSEWQHHITLEFLDDADLHFEDYKKIKDWNKIAV